MLPSDPRTWTDFSNPEAHGFEKVDCDTTLERAFVAVAVTCGIAAGVILWTLVTSRRPSMFSENTARAVVPALLVIAGFSLCMRWMTNNFYLVDPSRHTVYYHFQVLFLRRLRLLLERKDIVATAAEARHRRSRYRSWWEYRAVLIGTDGQIVAMSNWRRDDVWTANNVAKDLAKHLDCPWHEAAEEDRLVVRVEDGRASVSFAQHTWLTKLNPVALVTFVAVALVLAIGSLLGWWR